MIARLTGLLESLSTNRALIAPLTMSSDEPSLGVGGLAYEVLVPTYLADRFLGRTAWAETGESAIGGIVTVHTLQYLESQNQGASFTPRLLGFGLPAEREFFELLTTVKGLGNRRGLRAMAVEPGLIARAIADRDTRFLQGLPEIGPKLAELIVHELRSKADPYTTLGSVPPATSPVMAREGGRANPRPGEGAASQAANGAAIAEPKPKRRSKPAAAPTPPPKPAPRPPIREAVDTLVALGESALDAERMIARALDKARIAGGDAPATTESLISAAYAAR